MYTINQFLLKGRAEKNRVIKKILLRLMRCVHERSLNPLDGVDYPDPIAEDLQKIMQMSIRLIDWIEKNPNGMKRTYQQLEFGWNEHAAAA